MDESGSGHEAGSPLTRSDLSFQSADGDPYLCTDNPAAVTWVVKRFICDDSVQLALEAPVQSEYARRAAFGWLVEASFGSPAVQWCHLEIAAPDGTLITLRGRRECLHTR